MYQLDTSLATYTLKQAEMMLAQQQRLFNQMIDDSLALNQAMMEFDYTMDVLSVDQAMEMMFPHAQTASVAKKKSAKPARAATTKAIAQTAPRKDDLKLISGVGPGLEKKLQDAGITTYAQIAKLTEREITELETHVVKFAGRITRDDWIGQAKQLMAQ
jgi:predicted flap endonuclease-1-like 5' DNA nuclease